MATIARRRALAAPWSGMARAKPNDNQQAAGKALHTHLLERFFSGTLDAVDLKI